ncbi:MAG: hypothetical protein UR22_C0001G0063 [Parcubacteria group bacterium GW2011_GWC2_32_10]|nr:MAG: hypothetical protein UR22_C0001G0063 [Parcubacteria group bacterium GW2011_GWC2_32_10]
MIKKETIKKFQEAVKKDCGKELNFDEAGKILIGIVNYLSVLEKIYCRMKPSSKIKKS